MPSCLPNVYQTIEGAKTAAPSDLVAELKALFTPPAPPDMKNVRAFMEKHHIPAIIWVQDGAVAGARKITYIQPDSTSRDGMEGWQSADGIDSYKPVKDLASELAALNMDVASTYIIAGQVPEGAIVINALAQKSNESLDKKSQAVDQLKVHNNGLNHPPGYADVEGGSEQE